MLSSERRAEKNLHITSGLRDLELFSSLWSWSRLGL